MGASATCNSHRLVGFGLTHSKAGVAGKADAVATPVKAAIRVAIVEKDHGVMSRSWNADAKLRIAGLWNGHLNPAERLARRYEDIIILEKVVVIGWIYLQFQAPGSVAQTGDVDDECGSSLVSAAAALGLTQVGSGRNDCR